MWLFRGGPAAWVGLAGRLFLGYTFVTAGFDKLPHHATTEQAVRSYQLLPWQWVPAYASIQPALEIVIGIALILGLFTRSAAVLAALGLCSFLVGISAAWIRGMNIDCGCFGGAGATTDPHYAEHMLRDAGYLAIAVYLVVVRRTTVSANEVVFPPAVTEEQELAA